MSIRDDQRKYYSDLFRRHGRDPQALGHRDRETQWERYARLGRVFDHEHTSFHVHEIGCGFGDMGQFLAERHAAAQYSGSEVCDEFVEVCRQRFPQGEFFLRDITAEPPPERYDYVTQSGTLNGRFGATEDDWRRFVFSMLDSMYALCRRGIASNFLTTYSDPALQNPELQYHDPAEILDYAHKKLSRHCEIDAAGPLYEFTLRVYRPEYVRARYAGTTFDRYFEGRGN
ncbi:MAG: class I SAM-dependent methyltransferase [bacterium]|nr:class I SAM-dependent methyltransferase [bacterium]